MLCVAGVAAAFRSPVGGVLFALEEMTSWFRNELLWYAFFTTAVVSVAGTHGDRYHDSCSCDINPSGLPDFKVIGGCLQS